ncbi:hypothetical protein I6A84_32765 [Frankia sp. CNm7]|uniref:XRE family transcriptional regulator n=1 Tax=Frankia nepalensis TaxID=1836974 RepID=A0A937RA04_9ACTN|nr:hypothetical protein [Frankia nepalensis]MBL7498642.1 hypothetical protein [Frankia nepalensis]MBL7509192.1 hypothetical protein [Frankia nepalensis]MBL7522730.1 hypothetical protein [Frankia nepalensis]MBL7628383.1 hypothetical protein [Frankia nepalensis]
MPPSPNPRTLLGLLLVQRRWTVDQFCREYATTAARLDDVTTRTIDYSTAKRWVAGKVTRPVPASRRVLEELFGITADRLLTPPQGPPPRTELAPPTRAGHPATRPAANSEEASGNGPISPSVGGLLMAAEEAANFLLRAHSATTSADVVTLLTNEVRRIAHAFPTEGGPTLIPGLAAAQRFAFRHLDAPTDPNQARDVYFLAAAASGMLAHAARDTGQLDAAMTQTRTALLCADRAGSPALRVWLRNRQASNARWAGWHHDALRYTQLADADATTTRGSAAVEHAYLQARAYATVGDIDQAHAALRAAAEARDRAQPDDLSDLGGWLTINDADTLYIAADAHSFLPDPTTAEAAATTAVASFEATTEARHGNTNGSYEALALARARAGNVEGVREALQPILHLPPQHRVYGLLADIQRIHDVLTTPRYHNTTAIRDLTTELEQFMQDRPQPALPQ